VAAYNLLSSSYIHLTSSSVDIPALWSPSCLFPHIIRSCSAPTLPCLGLINKAASISQWPWSVLISTNKQKDKQKLSDKMVSCFQSPIWAVFRISQLLGNFKKTQRLWWEKTLWCLVVLSLYVVFACLTGWERKVNV